MKEITAAQHDAILAQQQKDWPKQTAGARQGNPFATLCQHCYGRHPPPNDEICPHESIADLKARMNTKSNLPIRQSPTGGA